MTQEDIIRILESYGRINQIYLYNGKSMWALRIEQRVLPRLVSKTAQGLYDIIADEMINAVDKI